MSFSKKPRCILCKKELDSALGESSFDPSCTIDCGGTVEFDFQFGSEKYDTLRLHGVCCDDCLTRLIEEGLVKRFKSIGKQNVHWREIEIDSPLTSISLSTHE